MRLVVLLLRPLLAHNLRLVISSIAHLIPLVSWLYVIMLLRHVLRLRLLVELLLVLNGLLGVLLVILVLHLSLAAEISSHFLTWLVVCQ